VTGSLRDEADARLRAWGVSDEEIASAREAGQLGLLALAAAALPGGGRYTADELAERAGMDRSLSKRLWRALGFPDVADDERVFTDADAEALSTVQAMISIGVTEVDVVVQLTRVIGSSQARIAEAMLSTNERRRGGRTGDDAMGDEAADFFAITADSSVATQGRLLEYVWRRHLQAAIRRRLMAQWRAPGSAVPVAVGFADLVGFTALSQQVSDLELAEIVGRFEALAFDAVTAHGGRVAKMIGDEAMFVVDDVGDAVDTALSLAEAYADDEVLSDVRVGLAYGDVLSLEGDYYGPVVNLASRIVNIAVPGAVVVSESVVEAMAGDGRFAFHSLRPRGLKDIGRVRLWRARRGHPSGG
jgi:adenylate cyclase